jgi:hypothetical protein
MEHNKGNLGRHVQRTSAEVDRWPAWMRPRYTKSASLQTTKTAKTTVSRAEAKKPSR